MYDKLNFMTSLEYTPTNSLEQRLKNALQEYKVVHLKNVPDDINHSKLYHELADSMGHFLFKNENPETAELESEGWLEMRYDAELAQEHEYRYGNRDMSLHIDGVYTDVHFDLIFYYCQKAAKFGGHSTFIDGEKVIEILRTYDSDLLDKVMHTEILFQKGNKSRVSPIIFPLGKYPAFNWNLNRVSPKNPENVLDLAKRFHDFIENVVLGGGLVDTVQLSTGEAVFFHNRLVLHGRTSFLGDRCLKKGAIDISLEQHEENHVPKELLTMKFENGLSSSNGLSTTIEATVRNYISKNVYNNVHALSETTLNTVKPRSKNGRAKIEVNRMAGALGVEVSGIDLTKKVDEQVFNEIHQALLTHKLLVFRNQHLSLDDQQRFAEMFGELDFYPFAEAIEGYPNIVSITKEPTTELNFGGVWHYDSPYLEKPPKFTILYGIDIPPKGGDTMFADMNMAYDALSDGMKNTINSMHGVFTGSCVHCDHDLQLGDVKKIENLPVAEVRNLKPIVRTHPETGKKGLFVSRVHIEKIDHMNEKESDTILNFLEAHAVQPLFTSRLNWEKGTLVVVDNRCVMHYALNDYSGNRREINRIVVKGSKPF